VVVRGAVTAMVNQWDFPPRSTPREIKSAYGYYFLCTVIIGIRATYRHMAAGGHFPVD
jgi:hypothetical protein